MKYARDRALEELDVHDAAERDSDNGGDIGVDDESPQLRLLESIDDGHGEQADIGRRAKEEQNDELHDGIARQDRVARQHNEKEKRNSNGAHHHLRQYYH